jgi:hypothetical protein
MKRIVVAVIKITKPLLEASSLALLRREGRVPLSRRGGSRIVRAVRRARPTPKRPKAMNVAC